MVATTPGSLSYGGSMHQKQPPANVATASPGGTLTVVTACASGVARATARAATAVFHFIDVSIPRVYIDRSRGGPRPYGLSHSHAAPRTPDESPCVGASSLVRTSSEKTCAPHNAGTRA